MLRFAHSIFLWGLLAVPVLTIFFVLVRRWKKKALARLGEREVIKQAIAWLEELGVKVEPVEINTIEG